MNDKEIDILFLRLEKVRDQILHLEKDIKQEIKIYNKIIDYLAEKLANNSNKSIDEWKKEAEKYIILENEKLQTKNLIDYLHTNI